MNGSLDEQMDIQKLNFLRVRALLKILSAHKARPKQFYTYFQTVFHDYVMYSKGILIRVQFLKNLDFSKMQLMYCT